MSFFTAQSYTETITTIGGSASSVSLASANVNRCGLTIFNDSTAALYVAPAATASTSSFKVKIASGGYYEWPMYNGKLYKGVVSGIWDSATGNARIVESTDT